MMLEQEAIDCTRIGLIGVMQPLHRSNLVATALFQPFLSQEGCVAVETVTIY